MAGDSPAPRVSVVIPAYNCAPFLAEAIQSVLAQTYRNIETIVIDDGSTDATPEVIAGFGDAIRAERQKNAGVSAARNRGMAMARGEFIALLDGDDCFLPEKIGKQVELIDRRPDCGLVYSDAVFVDVAGKEIANYVRETPLYRGEAAIDLFCNHFLMTPAVLFRKSLLASTGVFDETLRISEDLDFFLRVLSATKIDVVEEKLWARRVVPGSLSRQSFIKDAQADLSNLNRFMEKHPDLAARHRERVAGRFAEYHFSFGYRLLEEGMNGMALGQFAKALKYERSPRILKNLALCGLPAGLRKRIKGLVPR